MLFSYCGDAVQSLCSLPVTGSKANETIDGFERYCLQKIKGLLKCSHPCNFVQLIVIIVGAKSTFILCLLWRVNIPILYVTYPHLLPVA